MFHLLSIGSLRSLQVRRLGILVVAAVCLSAVPSWSQTCSNTVIGSFTCVRNATNNAASTSASVTYAGGYTVGQLIIVGVVENNGNAWAAGNVTNTNAYSWTFWGDLLSAATPQHMALYYAIVPSTTAGSDTITATNGAGTLTIIDSAIYSGGSIIIDGPGTKNSGNSTSLSSGTYTVTTNDLNVGFGVAGSGLIVVGAGWNNREVDSGLGGGPYSMLEDQSAASSSATAIFTAASGAWGVIGIAFKIAAPNTGGQFISGPMLPQVTPSVAYPNEALYPAPTSVASGANLQTAITAAGCGTILDLATNGSWSAASAYTLPNTACACHTDPTKWVIIRSHAYAGGSTRGVRLDPSNEYANLAHITNSDTNYAISALANGASCYWFLGVDVTDSFNGSQSSIQICDGSQTTANYCHDFAIDHSYIHGQPTLGMKHPIQWDGNYLSAVDSYISDGHLVGADSQGISIRDGFGPFLVQNNFVSAAAENFLSGGVDPQPGVVQADMTFTKNHFFKPLAWRQEDPTYVGIHWAVKNLLESKVSQRVLVTGNVLENSWSDGQNGIAISLKSSNTSSAPQSVTQDWTLFNNLIRHAGAAIVLADDSNAGGGPNNQPVHRISFSNDLFWDVDSYKWTTQSGGTQNSILVTGIPRGSVSAPYDVWLKHETFATANQSIGYNLSSNATYGGAIFTNSIIDDSQNGGIVKSGSDGDTITFSQLPGSNLTSNCIVGPGAGGTYLNAAFNGVRRPANQAATYVTPGSDFHVGAGSLCHGTASDGLDMGANIDAVNAATSGAVQTLGVPVTVTNVSPSTFTHLGGTAITLTGTGFLVNAGAGESGLGIILGGAGPAAAINTDTCAVNTCTVVMTGTISLTTGDTVTIEGVTPNAVTNMLGEFIVASVTDNQHFTYTNTGIGTVSATGGTANRNSPGNACTSVSVVSPTSITCTTPAASGTVTTGPVSVFVSQWGIPVQSTVFGNYN